MVRCTAHVYLVVRPPTFAVNIRKITAKLMAEIVLVPC